MALPQTAKAIVKKAFGTVAIEEVPLPKLRDHHLLVKTKAVSINPTDFKSVDNEEEQTIGTKVGCDFAGEVVEVGHGVTNFKVGDRIAGMSPGL